MHLEAIVRGSMRRRRRRRPSPWPGLDPRLCEANLFYWQRGTVAEYHRQCRFMLRAGDRNVSTSSLSQVCKRVHCDVGMLEMLSFVISIGETPETKA